MAGKLRKKDSTAILNSLYGGVVPNRGLEHIMVGRKEEATQILKDLETVKDGASVIKFIIGPFGSGKTFLQALIQQVAFSEKFVVGKVDFDANRRLYGSEGKSVATRGAQLRSLLSRMESYTRVRPRIIGLSATIRNFDLIKQWVNQITVNNGLDTYAVIKLSQETTQEELIEIVKRINDVETKFSTVEKKIDNQPKIHISATPPTESKDGDIWFQA